MPGRQQADIPRPNLTAMFDRMLEELPRYRPTYRVAVARGYKGTRDDFYHQREKWLKGRSLAQKPSRLEAPYKHPKIEQMPTPEKFKPNGKPINRPQLSAIEQCVRDYRRAAGHLGI